MRRYFLPVLLLIFSCSCEEAKNREVETAVGPEMINAAQPFLYSTPDALYMSWQENHHDTLHHLKYSKFTNGSWTEPSILATGNNWFINWADFPSITVDNQSNILSHYLPKSGSSTYAYDINVVLTGADTTYKVHDDTVQGEHGFVSAVPYGQDKFFITWLDGRNASMEDHHHSGAMSLRGAIINVSGQKENDWLLDEKVCDCCQTSTAHLENGGVAVVYRDRSGEEIRDISMRKFLNGTWTEPKKIGNDNWKINGCPVNGPKVVSSGKTVVVGWYSGEDNGTFVKIAISHDNGETFTSPVLISDKTVGRVDAAIDHKGNIWISHISMETGSPVLKAMQYDNTGSFIQELEIAELDVSRKTGFPQMEIFDKSLYFAWTMPENTDGIIIKRLTINI